MNAVPSDVVEPEKTPADCRVHSFRHNAVLQALEKINVGFSKRVEGKGNSHRLDACKSNLVSCSVQRRSTEEPIGVESGNGGSCGQRRVLDKKDADLVSVEGRILNEQGAVLGVVGFDSDKGILNDRVVFCANCCITGQDYPVPKVITSEQFGVVNRKNMANVGSMGRVNENRHPWINFNYTINEFEGIVDYEVTLDAHIPSVGISKLVRMGD